MKESLVDKLRKRCPINISFKFEATCKVAIIKYKDTENKRISTLALFSDLSADWFAYKYVQKTFCVMDC